MINYAMATMIAFLARTNIIALTNVLILYFAMVHVSPPNHIATVSKTVPTAKTNETVPSSPKVRPEGLQRTDCSRRSAADAVRRTWQLNFRRLSGWWIFLRYEMYSRSVALRWRCRLWRWKWWNWMLRVPWRHFRLWRWNMYPVYGHLRRYFQLCQCKRWILRIGFPTAHWLFSRPIRDENRCKKFVNSLDLNHALVFNVQTMFALMLVWYVMELYNATMAKTKENIAVISLGKLKIIAAASGAHWKVLTKMVALQ